MYSKEIQKHYVSEIDIFLQEFDKKHPTLSASQKKEIAKHDRVYRLRDDPNYTEPAHSLWEDF